MAKTSSGLEENVASLLCYLFGWVSGLIFFLLEKDNKTVRFNAMQSIVLFGGCNLLIFILGITVVGAILIPVVGLLSLVLWIVLMIKAFQGQTLRLPGIKDIAEKYS
jgi:uncharacterized membrane protein